MSHIQGIGGTFHQQCLSQRRSLGHCPPSKCLAGTLTTCSQKGLAVQTVGKPWLCQFSSQEKCCGVFSENYCALYLIESRKLSRSLASASYSCQLSAIKTIRLTQKPPVCLCPPGGFSVSEWCQDTCPGAIVLQIRKVKNTEKIVSLPL